MTIGFGFDPKTNDYKVVRVVTLLDSLDLEHSRTKFKIYSLSTGEWRILSASLAPICALSHCEPQAFVNGALHLVAFRGADDNLQHLFSLTILLLCKHSRGFASIAAN